MTTINDRLTRLEDGFEDFGMILRELLTIVRGIANTQQEHSQLLTAHSGILGQHTTLFQELFTQIRTLTDLFQELFTQVRMLTELYQDLSTRTDSHTALLVDLTAQVSANTATLAEHTAALAEHTAVLAEHTAVLQEHSVLLREHSVLLRSIVAAQQEQSGDLKLIKEYLG